MSGKCSEAQKRSARKWYWKNRSKKHMWDKKNNIKYKTMVMEHYSFGSPKCECCNEKHLEFLTIDHINGGGVAHRKTTGSGIMFYRWLINNKFPEGFRVLCMNCNMAIGHHGYCPHDKETRDGLDKS